MSIWKWMSDCFHQSQTKASRFVCPRLCLKRQVIDLMAEGYSSEQLDAQPVVNMEDWWDRGGLRMHVDTVDECGASLVNVGAHPAGTVGGQTAAAPTRWTCLCWMRITWSCMSLNLSRWFSTPTVTTARGDRYTDTHTHTHTDTHTFVQLF